MEMHMVMHMLFARRSSTASAATNRPSRLLLAQPSAGLGSRFRQSPKTSSNASAATRAIWPWYLALLRRITSSSFVCTNSSNTSSLPQSSRIHCSSIARSLGL